MSKRRRILLHGEWEDFELEFYDSYVPLWEQNLIRVVSDLFIHRIKIRMNQAELAEKICTT